MDAAGHDIHTGGSCDDEEAALEGEECIFLLPRALREDQQGAALFALFHRVVDGADLLLRAPDADRARTPEEPRQERVYLKQLFLGEHHHPLPPEPGDDDEDRVDGGDVVGRDDAALRADLLQIFPALTPDAEADVEHQPCQRNNNII